MTFLSTLAWRPFLDPLQVHDTWWLFLIPMALGISVVYKAIRVRSMEEYWKQVLMMTVQIVAAMVMLAVVSYLFVMVYVRMMANSA